MIMFGLFYYNINKNQLNDYYRLYLKYNFKIVIFCLRIDEGQNEIFFLKKCIINE